MISNAQGNPLKHALLCALFFFLGYASNREPEARLPANPAPSPVSGNSAPKNGYTRAQTNSLEERFASANPALYKEIRSANQKTLLAEMFRSLASASPLEAAALIDTIEDLDTKRILASSLIDEWSAIAPIDAYRWFQSRGTILSEEESENCQATLLDRLARNEPEFAWDVISRLDNARLKEDLTYTLTESWIGTDPANAFAWLERMIRSDLPASVINNCYRTALSKHAETDPVGAAFAIESLESESLQRQLVKPVVRHLAESDIDVALSWANGLKAEPARISGLTEIIAEFADRDAGAVLDFVLQIPDTSEAGASLVELAFSEASEVHPERAAARLSQMPEQARPAASEAIARNWFRIDEAAASDWLGRQLPGDAGADAAAAQAARHFVARDPAAAISWASRIGDASERHALLGELVGLVSADGLAILSEAIRNTPLSVGEYTLATDELEKRVRDDYPALPLPRLIR